MDEVISGNVNEDAGGTPPNGAAPAASGQTSMLNGGAAAPSNGGAESESVRGGQAPDSGSQSGDAGRGHDDATTPDWRHRLAGHLDSDEDRETFLNESGRFENEGAFVKRFVNLRRAQSRAITLPDENDPERSAKLDDIYTKLGRPEKPEYYEVKWDGPELEEPEQAALEDYKQVHFRNGGTQKALDENLKWWAQHNKIIAESRRIRAEDISAERSKELRGVWGSDFDENVAVYGNTVKHYTSEQDFETFTNLTLDDGTLVSNHPVIARMLVKIGRERAVDDFDYTPMNQSRKENAQQKLDALKADLVQKGIRPGAPDYPQAEIDRLAEQASSVRRRAPNDRFSRSGR